MTKKDKIRKRCRGCYEKDIFAYSKILNFLQNSKAVTDGATTLLEYNNSKAVTYGATKLQEYKNSKAMT